MHSGAKVTLSTGPAKAIGKIWEDLMEYECTGFTIGVELFLLSCFFARNNWKML